MRSKLLLTSLFVFSSIILQAQPVSTVRTFGVRDGLPTNSITAIRQGPSGLIWIATWNGLCSYDGNRITTFRGDPWGSDDALSSHRISAIGPDSQGNVWVRTYDEGLYLLDGRQCRYVNVGLLLKKKYGIDFHPRNIYVLPNGHTWINDNDGMLNLRIDDRYATNIDSIEIWGGKGHPIQGTRIYKVEVDAQGLSLVNFKNSNMRLLPMVKSVQVRSICCRQDGSVWAGSYDGHIGIFDAQGQQKGWLNPQGKYSRQPVRFAHSVYSLFS